uniref:Glycosyltransferase family 92 protein n=2 Tax=Chenopodium quinoa TaxID=63459 RepID=A0A803MBR4_CHEQI
MGLSIESRVLFNDHVLVILPASQSKSLHLQLPEKIDCVYPRKSGVSVGKKTVNHPMLSVDDYGDGRWLVRCPVPPANYTAAVGLKGEWKNGKGIEWEMGRGGKKSVQLWDMVAYEAVFDGEDMAVVFVKGLQLKPDRESEPTPFRCQFWKEGEDYALTTQATTAAQETIRCPLPPELKVKPWDGEEVRVTVEVTSKVPGRSHLTGTKRQLVPSIAKLHQSSNKNNVKGRSKLKYKLCACTMVWNQAAFIREWVMYHTWLGVERWFVYDNNSDDGLKDVIDELNAENYDVNRHTWPWIKSQEAGFSHCLLRARDQCQWVAFFDVDEFYNFPPPKPRQNSTIVYRGPNALQKVVEHVSARQRTVGEIRTDCHNFGPSGLKKTPAEGLMLGYTCRLKGLERHKSIVRPDAVDDSLLNQVHHFKLKKEFKKLNFHRAVINHYKYQVWDNFKAKFYRRVSTYVVDWQENQNENSRDRAPGLGTEAIEPPNWPQKFCEVWDTRLRDFVLSNLADRNTGLLPWQKSVQ